MNTKWLKIENIFLDFPNYNCFVCSPSHKNGFRLEFFFDPETQTVVSPVLVAEKDFAGFPGVLHGGFQAMLLDEIMFWAVYHFYNKMTVSGSMEIKYQKPVLMEYPLLLRSRVIKNSGRIFKTEAFLEREDKEVLTFASGVFIIPRKEEFEKTLNTALPKKFHNLF